MRLKDENSWLKESLNFFIEKKYIINKSYILYYNNISYKNFI